MFIIVALYIKVLSHKIHLFIFYNFLIKGVHMLKASEDYNILESAKCSFNDEILNEIIDKDIIFQPK